MMKFSFFFFVAFVIIFAAAEILEKHDRDTADFLISYLRHQNRETAATIKLVENALKEPLSPITAQWWRQQGLNAEVGSPCCTCPIGSCACCSTVPPGTKCCD